MPLAVRVDVDVEDGVTEGVGVPLAEPPAERVVVWDADTVEDSDADVDPLSLPEGDDDGVEEADPVPELDEVEEPVGVEVSVSVGVALEDALGVSEGLSETVVDGVCVAVSHAVPVPESVLDGEEEDVGVPLADPPAESVVEGVAVTVVDRVSLSLR